MANLIPGDKAKGFSKTVELKVAMDDAIEGYEKMLEKVEASFQPTVSGLLLHHRAARDDLDALLQTRGVAVDDDGSVMGVVHKTVVALRSLVDDVDEDFIPGIVDGETRNLKKYEDAIEENVADAALRSALEKQRLMLERLVHAIEVEKPSRRALG